MSGLYSRRSKAGARASGTGMQQLSEVREGRFEIEGFAGNAGPDHIDQFHGMPDCLGKLQGM